MLSKWRQFFTEAKNGKPGLCNTYRHPFSGSVRTLMSNYNHPKLAVTHIPIHVNSNSAICYGDIMLIPSELTVNTARHETISTTKICCQWKSAELSLLDWGYTYLNNTRVLPATSGSLHFRVSSLSIQPPTPFNHAVLLLYTIYTHIQPDNAIYVHRSLYTHTHTHVSQLGQLYCERETNWPGKAALGVGRMSGTSGGNGAVPAAALTEYPGAARA